MAFSVGIQFNPIPFFFLLDRPTSDPSPSNVTKIVISVASGVVVFIVVAVVVLCFIAKKKPWLFSFSHSRRDPESLPCQPMTAESENQNAEGAEVMRRMPEIGRFMELPCSSERSGRRGGLVLSTLDSGSRVPGSSPGVRVIICCVLGQDTSLYTLTVPLSTQE